MLRRLAHEQPDGFAFTDANRQWAEAQIGKYPAGRQASAVIPLLWRAQEQEGWLSRPAIEHVADMLGMARIRALEVATFYFMFQLHPVGAVAHVQVCGTLSCMICGAEDLVAACRARIAPRPHQLSPDGRFSWEEVECLGACANAPMAQIGKDYYEDLTPERLVAILDAFAAGEVPLPGPQNGRYAAEPLSGLTSLKAHEEGRPAHNASVALALAQGDTVKRIDGTEVPLVAHWLRPADEEVPSEAEEARIAEEHPGAQPAKGVPADETGITVQEAPASSRGKPQSAEDPAGEGAAEAEASGAGSPGAGAAGEDAQADAGASGEDATRATAGATGEDAVNVGVEPTGDAAGSAAGGETEAAAGTGGTDQASTVPASVAGPGGAAPIGRAPERQGRPEGTIDDLKRIAGIGPKIEALLHEAGIWHFRQIAAWGPEEIAWIDGRLQFRGRIERENWVGQARALAGE